MTDPFSLYNPHPDMGKITDLEKRDRVRTDHYVAVQNLEERLDLDGYKRTNPANDLRAMAEQMQQPCIAIRCPHCAAEPGIVCRYGDMRQRGSVRVYPHQSRVNAWSRRGEHGRPNQTAV
jgi:hypothetical protein